MSKMSLGVYFVNPFLFILFENFMNTTYLYSTISLMLQLLFNPLHVLTFLYFLLKKYNSLSLISNVHMCMA